MSLLRLLKTGLQYVKRDKCIFTLYLPMYADAVFHYLVQKIHLLNCLHSFGCKYAPLLKGR